MIRNGALGSKLNRGLLLLALFFGVVTAALVVLYLNRVGGDEGGGASPATVPVVVAAQDIAVGDRITAEMVTVKFVPADVVIPSGFGKSEDVVDKVAVADIVAGEQIPASRVVAASEAGQFLEAGALAEVVPLDKAEVNCAIPDCGLRAVSLKVAPFTAAAGLVRPGDRVDVIAAFKDGSAVTVVTDVELLTIDQDFARVVSSGTDGSETRAALKEGEEKPEAAVATLALWPEEAQKVAAAEEMTDKNNECKGSVRLALRHTGQPGSFDVPLGQGSCAGQFAATWGLKAAPVPEQPPVE